MPEVVFYLGSVYQRHILYKLNKIGKPIATTVNATAEAAG